MIRFGVFKDHPGCETELEGRKVGNERSGERAIADSRDLSLDVGI